MRTYNDVYGIGPWHVFEFNPDTVSDMYIRGERVDYSMKLAICDFYHVQLELIEPTDNHSIYAEFLRTHGPGLHHMAFATDNFHETIERMAARGNQVVQSGNFQGNGYAYIDTLKDLGFLSEIYKTPPGFEHPAPVRVYPAGR
ncbi:MAG: VOC family protein [Alicyclobacillaceae bacterium]|nr:VOC family protein [Alicyclobacillaceae bacterium]